MSSWFLSCHTWCISRASISHWIINIRKFPLEHLAFFRSQWCWGQGMWSHRWARMPSGQWWCYRSREQGSLTYNMRRFLPFLGLVHQSYTFLFGTKIFEANVLPACRVMCAWESHLAVPKIPVVSGFSCAIWTPRMVLYAALFGGVEAVLTWVVITALLLCLFVMWWQRVIISLHFCLDVSLFQETFFLGLDSGSYLDTSISVPLRSRS